MSLSMMQREFSRNMIKLMDRILSTGCEFTLGELYRTQLQAWCNSLPKGSIISAMQPDGVVKKFHELQGGVGIKNSLHCIRLAADLHIFKDGNYTTRFEDYEPFGLYWESLHHKNRWGGKWKNRDIWHFERQEG